MGDILHRPGRTGVVRPPDVLVQPHGAVQQLPSQGSGQEGQRGGQVVPFDFHPHPALRLDVAGLDHVPLVPAQQVVAWLAEVGVIPALHYKDVRHIALSLHLCQGQGREGGQVLQGTHPASGEGQDILNGNHGGEQDQRGDKGGNFAPPPPGIGAPVVQGDALLQLLHDQPQPLGFGPIAGEGD